MNNNDWTKVAGVAVTQPWWQWLDGMRFVKPSLWAGDTGFAARLVADLPRGEQPAHGAYPDLSDVATVAVITRLAGETPTAMVAIKAVAVLGAIEERFIVAAGRH
jgi:hypothetical protein